MSECQYFKTCAFFNGKMAKMPAMSEVYKKQYCELWPVSDQESHLNQKGV